MSEQNDHDLLIEIKTTVKTLADTQNVFMKELRELNGRVSALESKDRGDSEKTRAITKDVQESLNNSRRITELFMELNGLKAWREKLDTRGWQIWMLVIGLVISNVWAWFFK